MTLPGFFEGSGMPDSGWWEALWPQPARVLTQVGVRPGMSVIDLCCGDGWFTRAIAEMARHVTLIDIDASLIEKAEVRLLESGISNCTFITRDAYQIEGAIHEPPDHVFLANAFHGVPDKLRLAHVIHRVIKPGGLFAIVNWHSRSPEETRVLGEPRGPAASLRMTPVETIAAVEPAGFTHQFTVGVSPYHYGAVFQLTPIIQSLESLSESDNKLR